MDESSVGVVFFQGAVCTGTTCDQQHYWYFRTDASCEPVLIGEYVTSATAECVQVSGTPLWNTATPVDLWRNCSTDLSPQEVAGSYPAYSLPVFSLCERETPAEEVPSVLELTLEIEQSADLKTATVTLAGSGQGWLDGLSITGDVQRRRISTLREEVIPGACDVTRNYRMSIDLDGEGTFAPGSPIPFAYFDIMDTLAADCDVAADLCPITVLAHLLPREK